MGLLSSESGEQDLKHSLVIADAVAQEWNHYSASDWGINVFIDPGAMAVCCSKGAQLFSANFFPPQPGPFKRVAAFVVLGCLYPFIVFKGSCAPSTNEERRAWIARLMMLTIPAVLVRTRVSLDGASRRLGGWKKFPSPHYQMEFLAWLRWMDKFDRHKDKFTDIEWEKFNMERLARMVMATSLMLEACFYLNFANGTTDSIQSQVSGCLSNLAEEQEIDLFFAPVNRRPR